MGGMKQRRSLYQCGNARWNKSGEIYCAESNALNSMSPTGNIGTKRQERGATLELTICQKCLAYEHMGPPIPASERGWNKSEVGR